MKKNIFNYNRLLKPICEHFLHHRFSRLIGWSGDFNERGFKYPNHSDFYYKCKVCGYVYFNNHPSKEDIKFIKNWKGNEENK